MHFFGIHSRIFFYTLSFINPTYPETIWVKFSASYACMVKKNSMSVVYKMLCVHRETIIIIYNKITTIKMEGNNNFWVHCHFHFIFVFKSSILVAFESVTLSSISNTPPPHLPPFSLMKSRQSRGCWNNVHSDHFWI